MINTGLLKEFPRGATLDRLIAARFKMFTETREYFELSPSDKSAINDVYEFCRSPHFARIADIVSGDVLSAAAVIGAFLPESQVAKEASSYMGQCLAAVALPLLYLEHHIAVFTDRVISDSVPGDTTERAGIRATEKWKNADKL